MEERRMHPRVKTENLLSYEGLDESGTKTERGMGKTLDISQGGLLMETSVPVEAKFILLMSLDIKEELIKIDGLVKSRHSGENRSPDKLEPIDITGFRPSRLCRN